MHPLNLRVLCVHPQILKFVPFSEALFISNVSTFFFSFLVADQRFVEITVVFQGFHGFHNAKQKDPREYYDHVRENAQLLYVCNYR